jgi:2-hydroxycyclohexanecarboxyl-CoA dehydrogenase
MKLNLENSVAVVTGGAGGIGGAIAELFRAEGARVAVWDRTELTGEPEIASFPVDITDRVAIGNATARTIERFGRIDHLVHAAAIGSGKFGFPFDNLTPEDWPRVLEVNIMGMTNVAHAVAPLLRKQKSGTMTFLASVAGQIGSQTDPPYSASKAANINFAQCLAKDLASSGVRVNTVCPGMIQTALNKSVWQGWADRQPEAERMSYEEWAAEKIRSVIPLGSWQTPDDIANMVVFLASDRAAQVTGQTINVDGGFVMHW